ncbi:hypothetical protein niasHS_001952 [Heterodera schachtii]|uniref:Uncharacterized protein n=1 Tax=Heterodera schachtii TaxID=97005 RepID=A0ABD2KAY6_HETSC
MNRIDLIADKLRLKNKRGAFQAAYLSLKQINAAPQPNVTTPSAGAKPSVRRPCSKRTPKAASSSRRSTTQRQVNLSECRVVVKMPMPKLPKRNSSEAEEEDNCSDVLRPREEGTTEMLSTMDNRVDQSEQTTSPLIHSKSGGLETTDKVDQSEQTTSPLIHSKSGGLETTDKIVYAVIDEMDDEDELPTGKAIATPPPPQSSSSHKGTCSVSTQTKMSY